YTDLVDELARRGKPDAVALAQRTEEAACFTRALRQRWPTLPIIAGDGVYLDAVFRNIAGPAADDTYMVAFWHPDLPNEASRAFVSAYREATGRVPRHGDAVFVDAARLAAAAIVGGARSRADVMEYLRAIGSTRPAFDGIIGSISFAPGAARPLYMTRVTPDGSLLLPAR
ncbi:MAG TPA: ABC transporter substrate-binding protein, partial [Gemmatimonadaceae bacterium]|nr:ABC transporter substrate-binding protein [Gemmatimonadaceae bacterium]